MLHRPMVAGSEKHIQKRKNGIPPKVRMGTAHGRKGKLGGQLEGNETKIRDKLLAKDVETEEEEEEEEEEKEEEEVASAEACEC
ncbi:hypothetical protein NPIL_602221 [Nephila pilipes]|uniref:Uncharacterized protein n=1 Tax=Nephila pilipes TaxID=299642 RepID=A0A8X6TIW9_NEPPI|nr:hypothetical protein NPIL_602221 [Nephila pilipes]